MRIAPVERIGGTCEHALSVWTLLSQDQYAFDDGIPVTATPDYSMANSCVVPFNLNVGFDGGIAIRTAKLLEQRRA
jgi:hypothetical protein